MKMMNGKVLEIEQGIPDEGLSAGTQQVMLRALRAWERRRGFVRKGFRGMAFGKKERKG